MSENLTDWRWCYEHPREAAAEIDRLTAAKDGTGWLIEFSQRVSSTPTYYGKTDEGLGQTTDSLKAIRFARAEDAQAVIDDTGWTEAKPSEHMWCDAPAKA